MAVLVDRELRIRTASAEFAERFSLPQPVRGRPLALLAEASGDRELIADVRTVLADGRPIEKPITLADGHRAIRRVVPLPGGSGEERLLITFTQSARAEDRTSEWTPWLQGIIDAAVDAIITIDSRARITLFNPSAERLFGYSQEEVLGQNVNLLMPEPYHSEHDQYVKRYLETGERHIIGIGREVTARHKDGTTFPIDLAVSEIRSGQQRAFVGIIRDLRTRKQLEQRAITAADEEKRSLAQELHDGLGQQVSANRMLAERLAKRLRHGQPIESQHCDELVEGIRDVEQQVRTLSRSLLPGEARHGDLEGALERLVRQIESRYDISAELVRGRNDRTFDESAATHLLRIAQEAIRNAVAHGKATQITVRLESDARRFLLLIEDNGLGMQQPVPQDGGIGLRTMRTRAHLLGGVLSVEPCESHGVRVTCQVEQPSDDQ
ncbi:MAG: PAS domain S-box protein [bacterium]